MQCNVFTINIQFDSSKFRLVIWKRTKDKENKNILTKFTTTAPAHSHVSRGKKITLSLTDKVKLLDLCKQKPKLDCPLAELFKKTYSIKIGKSQIAKIIKNENNIRRTWKFWRWHGKKEDSKIARHGIINDVRYEWHIKCCQTGIYPDGAM